MSGQTREVAKVAFVSRGSFLHLLIVSHLLSVVLGARRKWSIVFKVSKKNVRFGGQEEERKLGTVNVLYNIFLLSLIPKSLSKKTRLFQFPSHLTKDFMCKKIAACVIHVNVMITCCNIS